MYRSSGRKRRTVLSKKTAPPSITASPSGEKLNQPSSPNVSSSLRTEIFSPYIALTRRLFITIATAILTILVSVETCVYYNVCMHAQSGQCVTFSSLCCGEGSGGGWIGRGKRLNERGRERADPAGRIEVATHLRNRAGEECRVHEEK
jgi:hypothetical protein